MSDNENQNEMSNTIEYLNEVPKLKGKVKAMLSCLQISLQVSDEVDGKAKIDTDTVQDLKEYAQNIIKYANELLALQTVQDCSRE